MGVIGHDERRHLTFVAHPKGIISCVIPTTNPNITILFNGVYALKGRNVILCAPHPRAKRSTVHTCKIFQEALRKAGAPENIFQYVEEPNIELTQMMMAASDTVLGTGGPNMVKAAYSSGKPAYGVGPGNSQTIFDPEYDNLPMAVGQTVFGCKFDNGIICACNRSFITPKSISAKVVELMKAEKVFYVDDPAVRDRARELLFPNGLGAINGKPVGQDVQKIAKMLDLSRHTIPACYDVKVNKQWDKYKFVGRELRGKTLGILGFGRIGQLVAGLAHAFKMNIVAYDPFLPDEKFGENNATKMETIEELLKVADYVTIHMPLLPTTKNLINAKSIETMKPDCIVLNMARGGIVNEQDMYEALKAGKIGGYATDVMVDELSEGADFNSPLFECDNFIVSPHLGAQTVDASRDIGAHIIAKVKEALNLG